MDTLSWFFSALYTLVLTAIYGFFFEIGYTLVTGDHALVKGD